MKNKKTLIGIVTFIVLVVEWIALTNLFNDEVIKIVPHELNEYGQELLINSEPDVYYTLPVGTYEVSTTSEECPVWINIYDANNDYIMPNDVGVLQGVYPHGTIEVTIKEGYVIGFGDTSRENPTVIFEKVS